MTCKVLVLGANGFIGSRLVTQLVAAGHDVRILTRREGVAQRPQVSVFQGDLMDQTLDVDALVSGCSVVFNCAGEIKNPRLMQALHVDSTSRLLGAYGRSHSSGHKRWVQLSSVGAYGPAKGVSRIVTEDTPTNPQGPYEVTKTLADELIVRLASEQSVEYVILRPSNVFARDMPNNSLRQLCSFVKRGIYFRVGRDISYATYIHVDDVVDALMLCGFREEAAGNVFNISNDCLFDDMIAGAAKAANVPVPRRSIPEGLIRSVVAVGEHIPGFPITKARIDALTVKTRYPVDKLTRVLQFTPSRQVPEYIGELV